MSPDTCFPCLRSIHLVQAGTPCVPQRAQGLGLRRWDPLSEVVVVVDDQRRVFGESLLEEVRLLADRLGQVVVEAPNFPP
jgi:hypothetical protein